MLQFAACFAIFFSNYISNTQEFSEINKQRYCHPLQKYHSLIQTIFIQFENEIYFFHSSSSTSGRLPLTFERNWTIFGTNKCYRNNMKFIGKSFFSRFLYVLWLFLCLKKKSFVRHCVVLFLILRSLTHSENN